jgi:hypothetical protein
MRLQIRALRAVLLMHNSRMRITATAGHRASGPRPTVTQPAESSIRMRLRILAMRILLLTLDTHLSMQSRIPASPVDCALTARQHPPTGIFMLWAPPAKLRLSYLLYRARNT